MPPNITLSAPIFEHHPDGFGIDHRQPRLSWRFLAPGPKHKNWEQTSYEIEIRRDGSQTGLFKVESTHSVLVPWPGSPLSSRERCDVRVRVTGKTADALEDSDWSPWATAETALLDRTDFVASFIGAPEAQPDGPLRPLHFRKRFALPMEKRTFATARLYVTAYGVYEAFINGHRVGDQQMAPGWTSYSHRLNYQTFDVTSLLREDDNVIAIEVAEGWYAGRLGWTGERYFYGKEIGVFAQLEILSKDDSHMTKITTDGTWKVGQGSLVGSEIYDGELFDAGQEQTGWNESSEFDESRWTPARVLEFTNARLVASDAPPVRITEEVKPVNIFLSESGKTIIDFGQNLVGKLFVPLLSRPQGHKVTFRHAEVMEKGELGVRPIRSAKAVDTIISCGIDIRNWSPRHTFHGFRYVQVDGWSTAEQHNRLTEDSIKALVMHTDMRRTGWFSCSEPLINKLHENTVWSMRGNFLSIPTDCPQRDERLGWTGDIQVFSPSANFLYDTGSMLRHWLEDVAAEQESHEGIPPFVVPDVLASSWGNFPQAVWDDTVVLVPWALYRAFGDVEILRRQYKSAQAWVDKGLKRGHDGLWDDSIHQLGDWLDPSAPPDRPGDARTDGTFVADAYLLRVTSVMSQIGRILGKREDADRYAGDYSRLKKTFDNKYMTPDGLLAADTQTGMALAIVFGLYEDAKQARKAAERLARAVRFAGFKVATGFSGTPIITHALSAVGQQNLAYRMLFERECPSWLYPITMGATTIWERWNSMLPDGSVNAGEMTSFNHYALGSIVNWLHEVVGGVSPADAGWKKVLVRPVPGGSLTSAEVEHDTPFGRLSCRWTLGNGQFSMSLKVPPNSRATVILPDKQASKTLGEREEGLEVGSGAWEFSCRFEPERLKPNAIVPPVFKMPQDQPCTSVQQIYPAVPSSKSIQQVYPASLSSSSIQQVYPASLSSKSIQQVYPASLSSKSIQQVYPASLSSKSIQHRHQHQNIHQYATERHAQTSGEVRARAEVEGRGQRHGSAYRRPLPTSHTAAAAHVADDVVDFGLGWLTAAPMRHSTSARDAGEDSSLPSSPPAPHDQKRRRLSPSTRAPKQQSIHGLLATAHQTPEDAAAAAQSPGLRPSKRQPLQDPPDMYSFPSKFGGASASNDLDKPPQTRRPNTRVHKGFQPKNGTTKLTVKTLKPQPAWDANKYFDETWAQLDRALATIFAQAPLDFSIEDLYRGVENLCRQKRAEEIYAKLHARCRSYVDDSVKPSLLSRQRATNVQVLDDVLEAWAAWNSQTTHIRCIFYYMDRSYLLQSSKDSLQDVAVTIFRRSIFEDPALKPRIIDGACELISADRVSKDLDRGLLRRAISMFHHLATYTSSFEPRMLAFSQQYVVEWAEQTSSEKSLPEYVGAAVSFMASELDRCELFGLDQSTRRDLLALLENHVIERKVDYLTGQDAVADLLDDYALKHLEQLHALLQRKRLGSKLRPAFERWIDDTGTQIVFDEKAQEQMVVRLLSLKTRLDKIWRTSFHRSEELGHALRESFETFINKTKKGSSTHGTDNSKPGEMIAKYIDQLLRGGAKAIPTQLTAAARQKANRPDEEDEDDEDAMDEDSEVNSQLDQVLDLFRFVHGKAVFEAFYKKDLARRLLMGRSASADAERSMLARLKTECGAGFTQNLEQMFKDVELAREEMSSYKSRMEERHERSTVDLNVNVLSAAAWPTYPDVPVRVPADIKTAIDEYEKHYKSKHSGRKLDWKHSLAHCQMKAKFAKGTKELVVSSFQAIVLLLFNGLEKDQPLTYDLIKAESGLPEAEVKRTLQSLACAKLRPITKHPKGREINDTDTFTVDASFWHEKYRVKINQVQLKETKEENKETHERVAADRNFECQAAVVRIMKSRKTIGHSELIAEVITATRSRGVLAVADIKKNVDRLIEKDYMEREEGNTYSYIA